MIVFGGGGHCTEVLGAQFREIGVAHHVVIVVDTEEQRLAVVRDRPILCSNVITVAEWAPRLDDYGFIAIGDPRARWSVFKRVEHKIARWVTLNFSKEAYSSGPDGSYFGALSYVDPSARIGEHAHINRGAHVAHDCEVGAFCHIAPGAQLLGACKVGAVTEIGANAVVLPNRVVGAGCRVGAGAVVTRDFPEENWILRGNPARQIERIEP